MSISNICRLCLHRAPILFPILNSKAAEMLEALTKTKIDTSDPLSSMCLKCKLNLKLAYTIQRNFLQSEEKLKSGFFNYQNENLLEIKVEIFDETIKEEPETTVCKICDESFNVKSLTSHTQNHFNEQICDLCDQRFDNIKTYRSHLLDHPNYSPYECDQCHATFFYKSLYDIHMKKAHIKKEIPEESVEPEIDKRAKPWHVKGPPFKCIECERLYPIREKLRHHYHNCHRKKECPVCKKLITNSNYTKHLQNHNSGPRVCDKCGKTYPSQEKLRGHYFYEHRGKHYECEECKITFKSRVMLGNHRKRQHNGVAFVCESCGMRFLFTHALKKHVQRVHLKLRPHVCGICDKKFSSNNDVKRHRRQHTNETPYRCPECGEGFKQNITLRLHRKSKHNVIEAVTCTCEVCGKGFASTHALKTHMKRHEVDQSR